MSPDEARAILHQLGIEVEDQRGDELIAKCPGHLERTGREDGNPSWSLNGESGMHHCFSCGFKGGLLYLVAYQKELFNDFGRPDWSAAQSWLASSHEVDLTFLMERLSTATRHAMPFSPAVMSEARLALFDPPPIRALVARRVNASDCAKYGVLWDAKSSSWITPIREADGGKLMGWQEKGEGHRHFRNRPAGVRKSLTLFGFDVWQPGQMVVVESPLDAVRLASLDIEGPVATYGASVSKQQVDLMMMAERLILAFDNDPAGRKASTFMLDQSRRYGFECSFFDYGTAKEKDVGDMRDVDVLRGFLKAKHCVLGKAAIA